MSFADHVWTLERIAELPDFSQRFVGRLVESGGSIVGAWEMSHDKGASWNLDFELSYIKVD
jgi:hypothetical protein